MILAFSQPFRAFFGDKMNLALIIYFCISAALIFLFFCHVNLVFIYDNHLTIYYKILFIKIKIYPFKKKKQDQTVLDGFNKAKNVIEQIQRYKELSKSIFNFYYRALRLKIINLDILIASKEPFTTALYYSLTVQTYSYLLKYFERNLILQFPKDSNLTIRTDFLGKSSHFKAHFVIYTYLGPLVAVGIISLVKMFISFIRRILNGDLKAKRVD